MRVVGAEVWNYYDGPTVFVAADGDTSYGQLVCGYVTTDSLHKDERVFDVYRLPPDGEPPIQVKESDIEWRDVDPTRPPGCICPTCTCRAGARNDFHVASPWVRSA
jgi:hypothetical protein